MTERSQSTRPPDEAAGRPALDARGSLQLGTGCSCCPPTSRWRSFQHSALWAVRHFRHGKQQEHEPKHQAVKFLVAAGTRATQRG